jgi:hypothetical protein
MTSSSLETWIKSMTSWHLKRFGSLSVQEDINIVEKEISAAAQTEDVPPPGVLESYPDSPDGGSIFSAETPRHCPRDESDSDAF